MIGEYAEYAIEAGLFELTKQLDPDYDDEDDDPIDGTIIYLNQPRRTTMPFIDMGNEFGDTKEPELAPEGQAYDLLCKDIEETREEGKKNHIRVMVLFEGTNEYAPMFHYLALPIPTKDAANDEAKGHAPGTTSKTKMLMIKRFLTAFGIPFSGTGFNPQDIPGARARLPVTQDTYTRDDGSTMRNNKIAVPNLPSEEVATGAAEKPKKTSK